MWSDGASGDPRDPPPRGSPGSGGTERHRDAQNFLLPAGSLQKKNVAKCPGYLRVEVGQQRECLPHSDCETFSPKGLELHDRTHDRDFKNCSQQRKCKTELTSFQPDTAVKRVPNSLKVEIGLQTARHTAEDLQHLSELTMPQSDNHIVPTYPVVAVCKGDFLPGFTSDSQQINLLGVVKKTTYGSGSQDLEKMSALGCKEVKNNQVYENKDMDFSNVQDHFISNFSFIQLSLNSASEISNVGPPSNHSKIKEFAQNYGGGKAENINFHVLGERQRQSRKEVWASSSYMLGEDCKCPLETADDDRLQDCERFSLLHANGSFCCSTDSLDAASAVSSVTSGYESSNTVGDPSWDSLMKKYEPALKECLQGNQSALKITSLIRKLQRLQEKAIAEDDFERGRERKSRNSSVPRRRQNGGSPRSHNNNYTMLQQQLKLHTQQEDNLQLRRHRGIGKSARAGKRPLTFQLPSRHPSVSTFLDRLRTQIQIALDGDIHRFNREENHLLEKSKQKSLSLPYHEKVQISATKRDQLTEEKEGVQKEIEVLKARLVFLEGKDQQLRKEIEEQDKFTHSQDAELSALLSWMSYQELQAIGMALADTSAASHKMPYSLDLPESIKSARFLKFGSPDVLGLQFPATLNSRLQEKKQSLNMSIKDTAAKVCNSQKLCSTLRKKVSDIETQLQALLETKVLAVSGSNFCTAKDLVEEIKSLSVEKEQLEVLLNEWLALSVKNVQNLEKMKESYKSLKEELEQEEFAFEKKLKENAFKYMDVLEEKLQSCGSQLLERVWEVDLEACQLLIREFQLKEGGGCVSEGNESQTGEVEDAADVSLSTKWEQSKHFAIKDSQWSALLHPGIQSTHWEQKEEFHLLSSELERKCEEISEKLIRLEDQLQRAICSCDEALVESLQIEIQMVKETLQAMLVQLQPAKEAEEETATALLGNSWCPGKPGLKE